MSARKNPVEPENEPVQAAEAIEQDEEQSLPEPDALDAAPDDAGAVAGALAEGRDAILRYTKFAPSRPGVYRMIDGRGDVLYVGKAKNIKKRVTA
jgi:excinuclease ABC subunit C